jgi:hypothetical protein
MGQQDSCTPQPRPSDQQPAAQSERLEAGTVVRHRRHSTCGTVVGVDGERIYVAWHGSFVEDELRRDDIDIIPDAPEELRRWRGGVGFLDADGTFTIQPMESGPLSSS